MAELDRSAIGRGAALTVAVCGPLAVASAVVGDGPLATVLFALTLVGFAAGGFAAARPGGESPVTSAGLAALVGFLVIQGVAAVLVVSRGEVPSLPRAVFAGILAFAAGLAGGAVATRRRARMEG